MGSKASKPITSEKSMNQEQSLNQPEEKQQEISNEKEQGGGCPMKRSDGGYNFGFSFGGKKPPHGPKGLAASSNSDSACPVKTDPQQQEYNVYSQPINPKNQMPNLNQLPSPQQTQELDTNRVASSIPKGGAADGTTWTYPSPQMFYNALARKNKLDHVDEQDMDSVVALHNNMNEKTWKKVCEWEEVLTGNANPKLLKFMGRPTDLSPKAWFKHNVLGHPLPYDRHDWTILRQDGKTTVRYVIDYYHDETRGSDDEDSALPNKDDPNATPSLLVDVRPALDGPLEAIGRGIQMPYARRIAKTTTYETLPMMPTGEMKSQVLESVQVWDNIQKSKKKSKVATADEESSSSISDKEAMQLAKSTAQILKDCQAAQTKLQAATTEQEMAKASMDLTMCMAKIVCPIQHGAVVQATKHDEDAKIEATLTNMTACVARANQRTVMARKQHEALFEKL